MPIKQETKDKAQAWAKEFPVGTLATYWPWGKVEVVGMVLYQGWPRLHCKLVSPNYTYEHLRNAIIYVLYSYREHLKAK